MQFTSRMLPCFVSRTGFTDVPILNLLSFFFIYFGAGLMTCTLVYQVIPTYITLQMFDENDQK